MQQEKVSRAEHSWMNPLNVLQEAIHYSFIKFCIYYSSLWYEFFVHYALRVEKNYQHGLDARPSEFQFLRRRGCLTNLFRTLSLFFRGHSKSQGPISRNNFVKKFLSASAIAIMTWQDATRPSFCSSVKECGTKHAHNFLFPKSSFRIRRTTVVGSSKILLSFLMRFDGHFLPNQQRQQCLPQFKSSSTSSLPSLNPEYHLKTFDGFRASFP